MRLACIILFTAFLSACSFDNKSGIWKNENSISQDSKNSFSDFQTLSSENSEFNKIINIKKTITFKIPKKINREFWGDIYYNRSNNFDNFAYNDLNKLIFKSSKTSKFETNNFILFDKNKFILNDVLGNLIVFSKEENRILTKFNFYNKKYKKIKKKLNVFLENNIIFVSDNLGYLYAYNYEKDKVLWAKNYKIPFRSNIKVFNNKLVLANQNNDLFFIDKTSGDKLNLIPTEETTVKNNFVNNISFNNENTFFLNTYGSLYSIRNNDMKINWFINLNQSNDINPSNLFYGNEVISRNNKIVVTSNRHTYILDSENGSIISKKNFTSIIKPLIVDKYVFFITKNNLLISLNIEDGELLYSYNINKKISDFLQTKQKKVSFKMLMLSNGKLSVFLKNSYVLTFSLKGELEKIIKLPSKIKSNPIFINNSIAYLDQKNKISLVD